MDKVKRKKLPAMFGSLTDAKGFRSSRKLIKLLGQAGAVFDRSGKGDHAIYRREVKGKVTKLFFKKEKFDPVRSLY
jgi:predicted RNA binding protein YcfA (HicA-like mRNA interferase family)